MQITTERKQLLRPVYIAMMQSPAFRLAVSKHANELLLELSQGGLKGQLLEQIDSIMEPFAADFPPDMQQEEFDFLATRLIDEMLAMSLAGAICSVLLSDGEGGVGTLAETIIRIEQFAVKLKSLAETNHAILSTPTTVN